MQTIRHSSSHRWAGHAVPSVLLILIAPILIAGCMGGEPSTVYVEPPPMAVAPPWAPAYENARGVRYYYLPDHEIYYDVWDHEFIYLDDGHWHFVRELPGPYATIDLTNEFVVVLNDRVYEPWMHHQYYVAHYPRYYYLSVYDGTDARQVRGFNENGERTLRMPGEVRAQQHVPATLPPAHSHGADQAAHPPRAPQRVHYSGDTVGKPVKVEPHMMRPHNADRSKPEDNGRDKGR